MCELIVRVLRAVACMPRLQILTYLARQREAAPTQLAKDLGMEVDLVCAHLAKLTAAGLIQRRRSGVWCYCRAESPYSAQAFSGRLARWLFDLLRNPGSVAEHSEVVQLRNVPLGDEGLWRTVFEAVTAFDNVRRLQMLRLLRERGALDTEVLTRELSMSHAAVTRHTGKLVRRGYLEADRQGHKRRYRLSQTCQTPVHASLWEIVAAGLTEDAGVND